MSASRQQLISQVEGLLADEEGTIYGSGEFKVALCYPSPYHVAMSSLGFQTIYRELNSHPGVTAERVCLPEDVEAYKKTRTPLFSFESKRALGDFDLVAFSVAYELEVAGVFEVLELGGLPQLRADRTDRHALVIAGGPLTFSNPSPLEPFVDVIVQGEAEEKVHELLALAQAARTKDEVLSALAKRPGFLVPDRGGVRYFVSKAEDGRLPARSQIVTPNTELRNMFLIEPERGCSRGCHYCVMRRTTNGGMRTVPPERVLSLIPASAKKVGLVGAAVTDHPKVVQLLEAIVDAGREVGVSSLRADRLTQPLVNALRKGGARVLTVASDGASQRMRDLVDRKHSEEQLVRAAQFARTAGMERLKVYSIVGLPLETAADIDELVRFTAELSKILPVALGVAPFVAKRNSPLDGAPFAGIKEVEARLEQLRRGLKGRAEVRPISARWAWVEHMLAQSGPEVGLAALDAWKAGGSFAAWRRAFEERGVKTYEERRVEDGRRNATVWPSVGLRSG